MVMTLYLAHNFETRFGVRRWELKIEAAYKIKLFNPFYDTDRKDIIQLDEQGETRRESLQGLRSFTVNECKDLVERDLDAVQHADGLLTIIKSPSIGTAMEIIMCAYIYRKPVFIITSNKTMACHPWLRYMVAISNGKIFNGYLEFKNWLKHHDYMRKKKVVRE